MNIKSIIPLVLILCMIAGCRGRNAHPIDVAQDRDSLMSCEQLRLEIESLNERIKDVLGERSSSNLGNAAAVAGSIIFLPALAFLDLSKAEQVEVKAFEARIKHLDRVRQSKNCR